MLKRLPARLAVSLAALATGLLLSTPRGNHAPDAGPCEKRPALGAPSAATPAAEAPRQAPSRPALPEPRAKPSRVAQQEAVEMPGVGRVKVTAYETDEDTRLVFEEADTGRELLSVTMADDALNPSLRFKAMHLKGLPDPTVVGVAVSPGGSGETDELVAVASVGGELKALTRNDSFTASGRGGFHFGELGRGDGLGLAVWDYVWDYDYEAHVSPHRYEVRLYRWNKGAGRFEWARVFRTAGRFDSDAEALRSVGRRFRDVREGVPEFGEVYEPD